MRTLQDLQANLNQLRSCYVVYNGTGLLKDVESRIQNIERMLVTMHQIMAQNLEHEIYIRKELTGENDAQNP